MKISRNLKIIVDKRRTICYYIYKLRENKQKQSKQIRRKQKL